MKKFKLIKTYPGSPELGTVIIESTVFTSSVGNSITYMPKGDSSFRIKYPMTYPEFWEEVVEKDYEILEIRFSNNLQKVIWQVKRLSDNEVFTVKDELYCAIGKYTIHNIFIDPIDNRIKISPFEILGTIDLSNLLKSKKPLFTTEDCVDIIKNDEFYIISSPFNDINNKVSCRQIASEYYEKNKPSLSFSSKKSAEEYILMNKPCLSINDIKGLGYSSIPIDALMRLIIRKIKSE